MKQISLSFLAMFCAQKPIQRKYVANVIVFQLQH
jgi:hypothetical protein